MKTPSYKPIMGIYSLIKVISTNLMPTSVQPTRRIFKTLGVTSIMVFALSACSETSWKEEALQPDGSKIIVTRTMDRGGRHEVGQQPPVKTDTLSFTKPKSTERITWTSTFSQDIGYADFMPLNVSVVANTAYVVTWPVGCLAYNKWGRPNPPYIVFKHLGTTWQQIPLEQLPPSIKTPNMVLGSSDSKVSDAGTQTVSAEKVQEINSALEQPELKIILREPLSKERITEMCGDGVWYKGYWVLPNDPAARALIDARQK